MSSQIKGNINLVVVNLLRNFLVSQIPNVNVMFNGFFKKFGVEVVRFISAVAGYFKFALVMTSDKSEHDREHCMFPKIARNVANFNSLVAFVISRKRFNVIKKFLIIEVRRGKIFARNI